MKQRILHHTLFWFAYVAFKTYLNVSAYPLSGDNVSLAEIILVSLKAQLVFLAIKVPLVYTLFYAVDQFNAKKWGGLKTFGFSGSFIIVATLLFTLLNDLVVVPNIYGLPAKEISNIKLASLFYNAFLLSFICGIAIALKLVRLNLQIRQREEETARKKLATELMFLKSQINPHFLFNTLNNIYGLARKKSDDTAEVVMKLSKLLRFMLYETTHQSINISDELKVVKDYIELEQLRYGSRLNVSYHEDIDNQQQQITPLILIPFVENAFKHGISETRFASYISISTQLKEGLLSFIIENSKPDSNEKLIDRIGLKNVKRQLELLYTEHHLQIDVSNESFKIILTINLNKNATL